MIEVKAKKFLIVNFSILLISITNFFMNISQHSTSMFSAMIILICLFLNAYLIDKLENERSM